MNATPEPVDGLDSTTPAARAYLLQAGAGRHIWFLGSLMSVKADSRQTRGAISLIEQVAPPGFASPLHLHRGEDEPMYILEGEYTFWVGEQVWQVGPGAFVFLPRDVPHCFRIEGDAPGRLLQLTMPGGLERAFEDAGQPAPGPVLPPPPPGSPSEADAQRLLAVMTAHHVQVLGPPPGLPGFPLPDPRHGTTLPPPDAP